MEFKTLDRYTRAGHEEPPEYVYRLETQLSTLIGDTKNAHMSWEESK